MSDPPPSNANRRALAWKIAPDLLTSFRYAGSGLAYTFLTQRNFRIQVFGSVLAMGLSVALGLSRSDLAILSLSVALVLTLELLNTAIESVVDLSVGKTYHELAKIAKDCAAGAVLIAAIGCVVLGGLLIVPVLLARLGWVRL